MQCIIRDRIPTQHSFHFLKIKIFCNALETQFLTRNFKWKIMTFEMTFFLTCTVVENYQSSLIDIIIINWIFWWFFQTLCESMNLLKSQSIGCSLLSSVGAQKRNEAQRCIYATWPSTDMTFVNPTELFQLLSSRLDNTKPQQQRELLLLGRLRIEPLFSKCRIFHAEFLRDAWLNTFRRGMQ